MDKNLCVDLEKERGNMNMKKYYVEDNADKMVVWVDEEKKAVVVAEGFQSIEEAIDHDYSGIASCNSAEDVAAQIGAGRKVYEWKDIEEEFDIVTEIQ